MFQKRLLSENIKKIWISHDNIKEVKTDYYHTKFKADGPQCYWHVNFMNNTNIAHLKSF